MRQMFRKEAIYLSLLLVTVSLIAWQHFGMNTRFSYEMSSRQDYRVVNDEINNGTSVGQLLYDAGNPKLSCDIQLSYSFPFCSLILPLVEEGQVGLNLERFDTLTLELDYTADERDTLLVYLSNYEVAHEQEVIRSNLQTLIPQLGRHSYTLELNHFYVPSWWVFSRPELSSAEPKLDNVRGIQISTGDHRGARHIEFTVHSFELKGKLIRSEELYSHIIAFWLVVALLQLSVTAYQVRKKYFQLRSEAQSSTS